MQIGWDVMLQGVELVQQTGVQLVVFVRLGHHFKVVLSGKPRHPVIPPLIVMYFPLIFLFISSILATFFSFCFIRVSSLEISLSFFLRRRRVFLGLVIYLSVHVY